MMATFVKVQGFCPMGCGATLYLDNDGNVVCNEFECPDDYAAAKVLADDQSDHVVRVSAVSFTIRHPVRERINDELLTCNLASHVQEQWDDLVRPGTYTASCGADGTWELAPAEAVS